MSRAARQIEQHYTVAQVAGLLGVDPATIWRRVRTGEIRPVVRLGHRTVRLPASAVARWIGGGACR